MFHDYKDLLISPDITVSTLFPGISYIYKYNTIATSLSNRNLYCHWNPILVS